ncbi:MAG: LptF/LptG family permease [Chthoniobacteraceae bacterium]
MTKIIDRYVVRQVLVSATLAVGVLTVVLVLGNIFKKLLNVLVEHDVPAEFIISIIGYVIPFSLTFTLPWGFLTAVLLVFGKMSAENELIALKSNGVSISRICAPLWVIALIFVGICLWINLSIAPKAQKRMNEAVLNIVTSNPLALFSSDRVIDEFPGRKIYVEHSEGQNLYNMIVYELDNDKKPVRVVHARRGSIETDINEQRVLMHLFDARIEQRDENNPDDLVGIHKGIHIQETVWEIPLKELYEKNKKKENMSGMTLAQLQKSLDKKATSALKTEVSKRFSFSLASLAFALMAVPLAITAHRKETSVGFAFSLAIAFTYFFIIILVDMVRDDPKWHPEWLIWAPNLIFFALGAHLFYRLSKK